jgi:enterochelin esterase-like enzyme
MPVTKSETEQITLDGGKKSCAVHVFRACSDAFPPDGSTRRFDVILPPEYSEDRKYPVIFMYDGQNLYRDHDSWNAPQTAYRLASEGRIPPVIIVGLYHGDGERRGEYFPQKAWNLLPPELVRDAVSIVPHGCKSDIYLDWVVHTVFPYVAANFAVSGEKQQTSVAGSSMGGLMSLCALIEYPELFGSAACMSSHWTGTQKPLPSAAPYLIEWVKENLRDASATRQRIYFDHGDGNGNTADLDSAYAPLQEQVDGILRLHGYTENDGNFMSLSFEHQGHHEKYWSSRFPGVLEFLLAGTR